ncbi:MAG: hypothetical protein PHS34_03080 [Candidatus Omnitrophica bacterium]|nr:hypothetical protein [Candidatus Omnitrophota bacterium]MDD5550246.1 hypothetical protein [Candidatus Omnitrophota bacterium]
MLLFVLFFKKELAWKYWIMIASVVFIGFLAHFLQNAVALGSINAAFKDLFIAAKQRINNSYELGNMAPTFKSWLHMCFIRNIKFINGANLKLIPLFLIIPIFLIKNRLKDEASINIINGIKLLSIFFLCGLSWWIIFPSHAMIHIQTATHMLLASVLLSTLIFYALISLIRKIHAKNVQFFGVIIIAISIIILLCLNISKSDLPLTQYNKTQKMHSFIYSKIMSQVGSTLAKDEPIFSNYWNISVMKYYSDRNCYYIISSEELKKRIEKHYYFIYFLFNYKGSEELFSYLKEHYRYIFDGYVSQNIAPSDPYMRFFIFEKLLSS